MLGLRVEQMAETLLTLLASLTLAQTQTHRRNYGVF